MLFLENDVLKHCELLDVRTRVLDEFDVADDLALLCLASGSNLMPPLKLFDPLIDQLDLVICGIDLFLRLRFFVFGVTDLAIEQLNLVIYDLSLAVLLLDLLEQRLKLLAGGGSQCKTGLLFVSLLFRA